MSIIGIDQSFTHTGVYVRKGNQAVTNLIVTSGADDIFDRAKHVADRVLEIANEHEATIINIEGLAFGATGSATRNLAGLQMLLVVKLREAGYKPNIISPKTLKVFATGNGSATKVEMFEAMPLDMQERIGSNYKKTRGRYDIVDAYWLAHYV